MGFWNRKKKPERVEPTLTGKRYFDAAVANRLTANFTLSGASSDQAARMSLDKIRVRSRDLARNSDYAKRYLRMVMTNVVGPDGFMVKAGVVDTNGAADIVANKAIADAFWMWSTKRYCDVTGRLSFPGMCRLIARTIARDGEVLVQRVRDRFLNPFGYALRIIDIDRLDTNFSGTLTNGNRVSMGVELDPYGRAVAYHLFSEHPNDMAGSRLGTQKRERVPADELFHIYEQLEPEQTRGIPPMHTAMLRLHHIKGFEEATVIAARIGASKMGFFTAPEGAPADGDPSLLAEKDADGNFAQSAEPGVLDVLPAGYGFESFNPDYPQATYDPFMKRNLQGVASGFEVAYHHLSGDLEGVNFSSIRAGTLEEREVWKTLQNFFIESFLTPLGSEFISRALLMGAITLPSGKSLPVAKLDKFDSLTWRGRRWAWVDPKSDILALKEELALGISSRTEVAAERGKDIADVWAETKEEEDLAAKIGIELIKPAQAGFFSQGNSSNDKQAN